MKTLLTLTGLVGLVAVGLMAQGRATNWTTYGGDPQRSGWARTEARITKDSAKDLQLLWKMKLESPAKASRVLMPPLIVGNLISYRGFKELAFVAANSDVVYAIDADLGKLFWTKHLEYASLEPQMRSSSETCPGGLTAMPTMPPPAAVAAGGRAPAPARGAAPAAASKFIAAAGPASVYAISGDGRLHRLNISTGDDQVEPVKVLPSNAAASALNMFDNVLYTVTSHGCNGTRDAVWAIDLTSDPPKTSSYALAGGGVAIGTNSTVYVQSPEKLVALSAKGLELKGEFAVPGGSAEGTSPLVIPYKDRDLIATAGKDGRVSLFDSAAPGAGFQTPVIAASISGNLSSWQDAAGGRWILVPVWGALRSDLKVPGLNGPAANGSIVAFKVDERGGKPALTPVWASHDLSSPEPPVIANGVVFALTPGGAHATLYALDAATGKEIYSSRALVTAPSALTGLSVANGRVYFGTADGTAYAFGIYMEH